MTSYAYMYRGVACVYLEQCSATFHCKLAI